MQIILTPEESLSHFHSALCNAVSTGYMRGYGLKLDYNKKEYLTAREKLKEPCVEDIWVQILKDGGKLTLTDTEENGKYTRSITLKDVEERVYKMPLQRLINIITADSDVVDEDVLLQTVFFNEVIFG
jgi:hypothetical protein